MGEITIFPDNDGFSTLNKFYGKDIANNSNKITVVNPNKIYIRRLKEIKFCKPTKDDYDPRVIAAILKFMNDHTKESKYVRVSSGNLYAAYIAWCGKLKVKHVGTQKFFLTAQLFGNKGNYSGGKRGYFLELI